MSNCSATMYLYSATSLRQQFSDILLNAGLPSGESANTKFIVFRLTRPVLKSPFYCIRGEHANHYTADAVELFYFNVYDSF